MPPSAPSYGSNWIGPRTYPFRRRAGLPVGEDDAKRGTHGYDAGKKVNGRKRHLLVDTLGFIWALAVLAANIQDPQGARVLLEQVRGTLPRRKRIWADGIYAGSLVAWVLEHFGWVLDIVRRSDQVGGDS
ncbi:MAG: transposase [Chloroflexi bacterium]|nr:transposase [Chloroflexota bacterium]